MDPETVTCVICWGDIAMFILAIGTLLTAAGTFIVAIETRRHRKAFIGES